MTPQPTTLQSALHQPTQVRRFLIRHKTKYSYNVAIERSFHRLHLRPIYDWKQRVLDFKLNIAPLGVGVEYEDAFGNFTTRFEADKPYTEMTIETESTVELLDVDPFAFANLPIRPTFPVSWMPWDYKMLSPYLTPIELPETQLTEIYDYAMSFVERNNNDLMETLFDINLTLFREYQYAPGSTSLTTTPYDVLVNKRGVCQDFANLFICMARLLGLPARYVCGYVYTGNHQDEAWAQNTADATHAWVQLHIPNVGWKGFDPTNGILPSTEHVRLAVGRHYRDTAPVAGTLYTMAHEFMTTAVQMIDLDKQADQKQRADGSQAGVPHEGTIQGDGAAAQASPAPAADAPPQPATTSAGPVPQQPVAAG
ncbi:MAG: transglutaminase family protein [Pirellulales bacterium]